MVALTSFSCLSPFKVDASDNGAGGYGVATGGPLAWGLCYNKEMSPSSIYCDDYFKLTYPCAPGVSYYGRGALPLYWYVVVFFLPLLACYFLLAK